jgi:hypothetical protein
MNRRPQRHIGGSTSRPITSGAYATIEANGGDEPRPASDIQYDITIISQDGVVLNGGALIKGVTPINPRRPDEEMTQPLPVGMLCSMAVIGGVLYLKEREERAGRRCDEQ